MRTLSPALLAHLQGDVRTICTLWTITRKDGLVLGFTDLDRDLSFNGLVYRSTGGYTHSGIEAGSTLSTSNLEMQAIFDSSAVTRADLEAGLYDFAAVTIQLVNYLDLTMGALQLNGGLLGQVQILNGRYTAELRGLAQVFQHDAGSVYSPTCRATFGDSKCQFDASTVTYAGTVASVNNSISFIDPSLTQTGPTTSVIDVDGHFIPTRTPFTIQIVPPNGGAFASNNGVRDTSANYWSLVGGTPGDKQYNLAAGGLYTFSGGFNPGAFVYIDYSYTAGYFAYGRIKWLTGLNAGLRSQVKAFAPGVVTIALALPNAIQAGDTYSITAGCDLQPGTCSTKFNNLIHFRGEPFIPGQDVMISPKG
ncbi:hypothetical protein BZM27_12680 [Paraburkholderia steynii]|uniref:Bacteriophage phiJL001 Gp84 C-terminal domain-containing protein n=1 Tax=Paraburkholderia steynii TaxID=1245441 RepID=A0A4R0XGP0_9BURK|nr:hypothetical protein BZM27_12680 [Paraburkholderia steynii]